jgi:MerR family transcriptional regulator, redox-sensitive transcriptional activator SoxR
MVTTLSIGEVAQRTGLRASALRYYEESGLLPAPARVKGRRVYDDQVIRRIDGLRFAQEAGFTLKEIKVLFQGSGAKSTLSARWQSMARKKLLELEQLAARVVRMRAALELGLKCGCVRIEDCTLSPDDVPAVEGPSIGGCKC